MSPLRLVASLPVVLFACALGSAGLGGCYDLSTSGPRPEDFANTPAASEPAAEKQTTPPASPTALDRSDAILQVFGSGPTPPTAEPNVLLPAQNITDLDTPR